MIEEIVPNLYRAEIPLPKSPLKWLNSYIVRGESRFLIIDTGFNCGVCLEEMSVALRSLNVDLSRTDLFITHLHVDHIGLAGTLATKHSKVYFNEQEAQKIRSLRDNGKGYWCKMVNFYIANGFPGEGARSAMEGHPAHRYGLTREIDFTFVKDGDRIEIGDFCFRCVATPGHSPGHTSLYEERHKMLIAGDHILFDITPNITYWLDMEDALAKYLESLQKVCTLDVKLVLTGHRRLVHNLQRRVAELQEHHCARLNEVLLALGDGPKNVLQIAPHIAWNITAKNWDDFPPPQKWFAFGETMAHVKYLEDRGRVLRRCVNGSITYALA
jgi:glyoxylase-like metal-dependent hydrolase (beta-lactamase superfamily II)